LREDSAFFSFPQVFRKIRQPDQYDREAHDIHRIDPAVKHSGNKGGKRQADNGSDYKNGQLIHCLNFPEDLEVVLSHKMFSREGQTRQPYI